jgi:hypothetical protein
MFFRSPRPKIPTFAERIELLRSAGFQATTTADGRVLITKHGVGALVGDEAKGHPRIDKAGILVGSEIAVLVNAGYQVFLETPGGKRFPALSDQLQSLHQFEDDLKEALDVANLYNTSLGTTNQRHNYDRVAALDKGR